MKSMKLLLKFMLRLDLSINLVANNARYRPFIFPNLSMNLLLKFISINLVANKCRYTLGVSI